MPLPEPIPVAPYDIVAKMYEELQDLRRRVEFLEGDRWLSNKEAADYLGCGLSKLYDIARKGEIVKSGSRFQLSSCRDYMMKYAVSERIINKRLGDLVIQRRSMRAHKEQKKRSSSR